MSDSTWVERRSRAHELAGMADALVAQTQAMEPGEPGGHQIVLEAGALACVALALFESTKQGRA